MKIWSLKEGRLRENRSSLKDALGLKKEEIEEKIRGCRKKGMPYVIAMTGAGGKTTAMYCLAGELAGDGWKVAVTTTTRIFRPEKGCVFLLNEKEAAEKCYERLEGLCRKAESEKDFFTAGVLVKAENGRDKMSALPDCFLERLKQWTDILLTEADGSKHFPLKVPAPWEPVIPQEASFVIGCAGLSSLGRPWRKVCFRSEYGKRFFPGELVTAQEIADILTDSQGTKKSVGEREYAVLLNQADSETERKQGEKILKITEGKWNKGLCTCFLDD